MTNRCRRCFQTARSAGVTGMSASSEGSSEPAPRVSWTSTVCHAGRFGARTLARFSINRYRFSNRRGEDRMKPLRAARTAGVLKDLLDVLYWAIVILAPVYAALVAYGYAPGGRPGDALVADAGSSRRPRTGICGHP